MLRVKRTDAGVSTAARLFVTLLDVLSGSWAYAVDNVAATSLSTSSGATYMPCFSNSATVLSSAAARSGRGRCFTSSSRGIPSSGVAVIGIIHRRLVTDNVIIGHKKFFDKGFEKEVGGVL